MLLSLDKLLEHIEVSFTNDNHISAFCPFHDDENPSLSISLNNNLVYCFAGCFSGDVVSFYSRLTGKDLVRSAYDLFFAEGSDRDGEIKTGKKRDKKDDYFDVFDENCLDSFGDLAINNRYMLSRGFTDKTIKSWEIRYNKEKERICIPIRDIANDIVGLVFRNLESNPKYLYTSGFPRKYLLFGAGRIVGKRDIIITEGSLDCIWLWQNGYSSVAVLGSDISEHQCNILCAKVKRAWVCGDNDKAGRKLNSQISNMLEMKGVSYQTVNLRKYKDIQEVPANELKEVLY